VIDHVYISVADIGRSLAFYSAALEPLGWRELGNYDSSSGPEGVPDLYGLGDDAYGGGVAVGSSAWLRRRQPGETGLYVGFVADDHAAVDAAFVAAINAGGTNEGKPSTRASTRAVGTPLDDPVRIHAHARCRRARDGHHGWASRCCAVSCGSCCSSSRWWGGGASRALEP